MELDELRDEIAKRDREIVRLIAERTKLAREVGRIKLREGKPIRNVQVEEKVIARYTELSSENGLDPSAMKDIALSVIRQAVDAESALVSAQEPRRISVIGGAGKMGAWTASLFRASGHDVRVIDPASGNGFTVKDCADSDIIVISVPIHAVEKVLKEVDGVAKKDALIFDLSSLKTPFISALREMATRRKMCSIHPMFGPSAKSMYNRNLIICDCGCKEAVDDVKELFDNRGGNIRIMPVEEHDGYMSYVLGLTHAVNIALFTVLDRSGHPFSDLKTVSSTTFEKGLDTNRSVAMEDPLLYYEIQHMNGSKDKMWSLFSDAVKDLMEASKDDDSSKFVAIMNNGRAFFEGQ